MGQIGTYQVALRSWFLPGFTSWDNDLLLPYILINQSINVLCHSLVNFIVWLQTL